MNERFRSFVLQFVIGLILNIFFCILELKKDGFIEIHFIFNVLWTREVTETQLKYEVYLYSERENFFLILSISIRWVIIKT